MEECGIAEIAVSFCRPLVTSFFAQCEVTADNKTQQSKKKLNFDSIFYRTTQSSQIYNKFNFLFAQKSSRSRFFSLTQPYKGCFPPSTVHAAIGWMRARLSGGDKFLKKLSTPIFWSQQPATFESHGLFLCDRKRWRVVDFFSSLFLLLLSLVACVKLAGRPPFAT